jgi:mRNA-degrading endonuclease HigB of HigAB toxin-antitoxin module
MRRSIGRSSPVRLTSRRSSVRRSATVDFVGDSRLILDVGGNRYRLVVHVSYTYTRVLVKSVGTRAEYDRIEPETV